jgi:hypothetical protein
VDPADYTKRKKLSDLLHHEDMLVPVFSEGKLQYQLPAIHQIRERVKMQLDGLHEESSGS